MRLLLSSALVILANIAPAQDMLSREDLEQKILSLSSGQSLQTIDMAMTLIEYELGSRQGVIEVQDCIAHLSVKSTPADGPPFLQFEAYLDLRDHELGPDYDTNLLYKYETLNDPVIGPWTSASITLMRKDFGDVILTMKDQTFMQKNPSVSLRDVPMVEVAHFFAKFPVINPTDETQLVELTNAITEYQERFCQEVS